VRARRRRCDTCATNCARTIHGALPAHLPGRKSRETEFCARRAKRSSTLSAATQVHKRVIAATRNCVGDGQRGYTCPPVPPPEIKRRMCFFRWFRTRDTEQNADGRERDDERRTADEMNGNGTPVNGIVAVTTPMLTMLGRSTKTSDPPRAPDRMDRSLLPRCENHDKPRRETSPTPATSRPSPSLRRATQKWSRSAALERNRIYRTRRRCRAPNNPPDASAINV